VNELHLFAGTGGGILGGILCGHTTVCAVEIEPYCRKILLQRQRDKMLPKFPIWDDIRTFDGRPWKGKVDIVCGGFPCQDISAAGKGAGINGAKSGMWAHMARIIGEVRPGFVFVENSPMLTSRGLGRVLGDLAQMGYNARWGVLGAIDCGAPHKRDRIWIVGTMADSKELFGNGCDNYAGISAQSKSIPKFGNSGWKENVANPSGVRQSGSWSHWYASDPAEAKNGETDRAWTERVGRIWGIESRLGRVANGVANRVDRLKAIGNGQVPIVAALAWEKLSYEETA
jgi:DNA (cytosine-5)-methyltransferase 1